LKFLSNMQDEAEQSLRLQETFFREFTLVDGMNELADFKIRCSIFWFRLRS
jgi:hypothetical protein